MSDFLDTNVVVYAFDTADPEKQRVAIDVLESGRRLVVSTQVLLEAWWVLTRRLERPLSEESAGEVIALIGELTRVLLDHPHIAGYTYTQLTDVEHEVNGIFSYDRRAKFDVDDCLVGICIPAHMRCAGRDL